MSFAKIANEILNLDYNIRALKCSIKLVLQLIQRLILDWRLFWKVTAVCFDYAVHNCKFKDRY